LRTGERPRGRSRWLLPVEPAFSPRQAWLLHLSMRTIKTISATITRKPIRPYPNTAKASGMASVMVCFLS
jgi:hypothetical protein